MSRILFSAIILFFTFNIVLAQGNYKEALQNYRKHFLPEKVFVHTDKDVYAVGETIWGAIYLVDGQTHKPNAFSTTVHVELANDQQEILQAIKVFVIEGHATMNLDLPSELAVGNYQLRAYTNYQQNSGAATLFRKTIAIVNGIKPLPKDISTAAISPSETFSASTQIKLQFFPEGGDCVVGLPCKTALIAQDPLGNPIAVSGQIFDNQQNAITFFETNAQGMGQFSYLPQLNQPYTANIKGSNKSFVLPTLLDKGYTLNVLQQGDSVSVLVHTNLPERQRKATMVIHHRGLPFIETPLNLSVAKTVIPIQRQDLLPGVYVTTLFDAKANPVAERLFFIAPAKESTSIDIDLPTDAILPNQKLDITLHSKLPLDIEEKNLLASNVSLSVVPAVANINRTENIRTWLILNSDLDVPIQDAGAILFDLRPKARDYIIDQFLLTRGWRRFRWKEILASKFKKPTYTLEQGLAIKGKLLKAGTEDTPQKGKVFLSQMEHGIHEEVLTDEKGNFSFGPFILYDTSTFILQGRFKKSKKKKPAKNISFEDNPYVNFSIPTRKKPQLPISPFKKEAALTTSLKKYESLSSEIATVNRNYEALSFDFDAVDISAKRITQKKKQQKERSYLYNGNPSYRMVLDDVPGASQEFRFIDLILRLPGVRVTGNQIYILGGPTSFVADTNPLFVLDGAPIEKETALTLVVREIEFVDILRGADATIYGARGGAGVILIYTKKRFDWEQEIAPPPGLLRTELIGFHVAKEYADINFRNPDATFQPDMRTTLHWNPSLFLPNKDNVTETIKVSNKTGHYIIIAQGLRKNGMPLFGSREFVVEDAY